MTGYKFSEKNWVMLGCLDYYTFLNFLKISIKDIYYFNKQGKKPFTFKNKINRSLI